VRIDSKQGLGALETQGGGCIMGDGMREADNPGIRMGRNVLAHGGRYIDTAHNILTRRMGMGVLQGQRQATAEPGRHTGRI